MSRTDIHSIQAAHSAWATAAVAPPEEFAVTVTITPRVPVATAHVYALPTVREIPPVQRPGTFDSTW